MPKVIVKEPGKDLRVVEFDGQYRCDVKQFFTDDTWLEYVNWNNWDRTRPYKEGESVLAFACDENGLVFQLPLNFFMYAANWGIQTIVGTVVFFRYKWEDCYAKELWDFTLQDVTDGDIVEISNYVCDLNQRILQKMGGY